MCAEDSFQKFQKGESNYEDRIYREVVQRSVFRIEIIQMQSGCGEGKVGLQVDDR